ncbi:MAG: hypothetical protein EON92_03420 [Burkholderiales bacterium]|nr:MAG: hypothetical protein EON92_03420 [Burkholderiales bacterium]
MPRKKPPPPPPVPGRPSRYKPEMDDQARRLCLLGYSDVKLATFFGVGERTINDWKVRHPSFKAAVWAGRDEADTHVVSALYQKACGYTRKEVDIRVANGEVIQTPIEVHYPPDTPAAMFWLTNRQKGQWKGKQADMSDDDSPVLPVKVEITVKDARVHAEPERPAG